MTPPPRKKTTPKEHTLYRGVPIEDLLVEVAESATEGLPGYEALGERLRRVLEEALALRRGREVTPGIRRV